MNVGVGRNQFLVTSGYGGVQHTCLCASQANLLVVLKYACLWDIQKERRVTCSIVHPITNAKFLEDDYIKNMKPRSRMILEEILGEGSSALPKEIVSNPVVRET